MYSWSIWMWKTTLMNMIGGLIKTEDQIIEFNDNKKALMKNLVMFFKHQDCFLG